MSKLLKIKRYTDTNEFLTKVQEFLETNEIINTIMLTRINRAIPLQLQTYCGTVWNQDNQQLVFVLFGENKDFLYASHCSLDNTEAIDLLIHDVLSTNIDIQGIHGYQPTLNKIKYLIESQTTTIRFEDRNACWSYGITAKQLTWSTKAKKIKESKDTQIRIATQADLPMLRQWNVDFISECFGEQVTPQQVEEICKDMLAVETPNYLLIINHQPVTMAWKVRPLKLGNSLAYVYTPKEFRHKGYGATLVTSVTEIMLQEKSHVTLFANIDQDPHTNLYTSIGYKWAGEAGLLKRIM